MQRFRSMKTLQKFNLVHARVHNQFNQERHLVTRKSTSRDALLPWPSGAPLRRRRRSRAGVSPYASVKAVTVRRERLFNLSRSSAKVMSDFSTKTERIRSAWASIQCDVRSRP